MRIHQRIATHLTSVAAFVGLVACLLLPSAYAQSAPPLTSHGGVVAADNETASRVGAAVLAAGGNAIDAAAATALALGVVSPLSSGIGGGGFALVYIAEEGKTYALDFRESAPAALTPESFVVDGEPQPSLAQVGGLAVGVPGEIAGLAEMVDRFGELPFRRTVLPACRLAHAGFALGWFVADRLAGFAARTENVEELAPWLFPGGEPATRGEIVRRPRLARTLAYIAQHGPAGFYEGPVARDIVRAVQAEGGVMTLEDLASYEVIEREPLVGSYRGYTLATFPLPSSGGIVLLQALGILEAYEEASGFELTARPHGSSASVHVLAEVLKHAFADRARYLGDEDGARRAARALLRPERLAELADRIDPDAVLSPERYGDPELGEASSLGQGEQGTSHLCVVDRDGNAVALTTTINHYYGAKVVAERTGIVLNNEVDDFAIAPETANLFGLVQAETNLVGPGKRPLSSMSPTLVFEGDRLVGCFGGSGGPRIISNTFHAFLNVFVYGMTAAEAVSAPRFHHQWSPDLLRIERASEDVLAALEARGHKVEDSRWINTAQAIVIREDGLREAASDPRKGGAPAASPGPRR
jgi:gamma-glutamyltranspeptidase / glutathione hydrolase